VRAPALQPLFVAKRRFDRNAGERWQSYLHWSGLSHLREVVSLDTILCPTVPDELIPEDWEHNVHADYQTCYFRSLDYLRARVAGQTDLNLLAIMQHPSAAELAADSLPGFVFLGFDLLDVCGDVSALTDCGGFDDVFTSAELSPVGLLTGLERAYAVRDALRGRYPEEHHARCDVWAIWRLEPAR
jgi:hypothetical protein